MVERLYEIVVRCRVKVEQPEEMPVIPAEKIAEYILGEEDNTHEDVFLHPTGATMVSARVVEDKLTMAPAGFTVRFYKDHDGVGGELTKHYELGEHSDQELEKARAIAEQDLGEKLLVDDRTSFPMFVVYRDGVEVGGG